MVFNCNPIYPLDNESQYEQYYKQFPHDLHDFQKWSIEALTNQKHVLVTAPTGTGKSVVAEFAIRYFHSLGKKVIYCSPIKALSNQKFYDFSKKFPDISVGIITGDISSNTTADVLIMTTEILLNKLYKGTGCSTMIPCLKEGFEGNIGSPSITSTTFDMNIETELACVVFDEIHMINDASRGHVWEQSIMMMPDHVQIVGLSATLDDPVKFAQWIEMQSSREIYLAVKLTRTVPLTHYSFITVSSSAFKHIKDKTIQAEINSLINKPFIIQSAEGSFNNEHYNRVSKVLTLLEQNAVRVKRGHVLNKVTEYLTQNEMLPALCYVFSRKQLEVCAKELTTNLLEFDSKIPYTIRYDCEQIIRKLPNYQEYLHLPEYVEMVQLLEKGVGMHHSGIIPVLREMVELLFAQGKIKLLFCTESVAIGLNLPVKTTIFTDICKHDGQNVRMLHGHEYTQAAGRAGRLGLDAIGHVIHLNNLFRKSEIISYKTMLKGAPQTLSSHFKLSYHLLLELIQQGKQPSSFSRKSLIQGEVDNEIVSMNREIDSITKDIHRAEESMKHLRTPIETVRDYMSLLHNRPLAVNKKKKEIERRLQTIKDDFKYIESDMNSITIFDNNQYLLAQKKEKLSGVEQYVDSAVESTIKLLENKGFLNDGALTAKGHYASSFKEVHCLAFSDLLVVSYFNNKTVEQLVEIFSCFTNISVQEDYKDNVVPPSMTKVVEMYESYLNEESLLQINTGIEYELQYDLMPYMAEWCRGVCVEDCKWVLQKMLTEKGIFLGEFIKALLKINNIALEMAFVAEKMGDMNLLEVLKEIPDATLKYVVTNQSLYV
jgi:superfamily II RNA helicase